MLQEYRLVRNICKNFSTTKKNDFLINKKLIFELF